MRNLFVFGNRIAIWDTMAFFYAVARGRNPGIYSTWEECKAEVNKFPAPMYKKFSTKSEAENFILSRGGSSSSSSSLSASSSLSPSLSTASAASLSASSSSSSLSLSLSLSLSKPKSRDDTFAPKVSRDKKFKIHSLHDEMEKRLKDWATGFTEEMSQVDIQVAASKIAAELGIPNFSPFSGWLKYHIECNPTVYKSLRVPSLSDLNLASEVSGDAADDASPERNAKLAEKLSNLESKILGISTAGRSIPSRIKFLESTLLSLNQELNEIKRSMSTNAREVGDASVNRKRRKIVDFEEEKNSGDVFKDIDLGDSGSLDKFDVDSDGYVNVYTDGACSGNGKSIAFAGIGVWFGDNNSLNVSRPVAEGSRATNNLAEIQAVTAAARQAVKAGIKKLKINTDSQFLISCITRWMPKWKRNGWKTAGGKDVINKVELIEMENAIKPLTIAWNHVRGHAGVYGNEMADELARAGAEQQKK